MKRKTTAGIASFTLPIIIYDTSSTTGAGLSGVTHSSSGLVFEYRRQGQSSWTSVTPVSATLGTYTSGGIVASGSRTGRYEIGIPDAALAAGARFVEVCLRGAANMHPVDIEIELDAVDYQDATAFGLSRIDATIGSRATQASLDTAASYIDTEVAAIKAKTDNLPSDPADASDISASFVTVNNTLATIAGYIDTEVAAIKSKTDNLPSDPADASDIAASFVTVNNTLSTISGYIDTEVAAIKAKTDNLPTNPAAVSDIPTANQNRDAILNADPNAGYTDGSFGDRWLISDNNNRTVKVTGAGAGHVAADLHASQTDSLTADAITAAAVIKIQNGLALEASSQSILARIGAFTGTGVNTILGFFRALLRSDASITTPSDVGGTYTHTTDSTQAIRDRGDAAWTTGGGGGGTGTGARTVVVTVTLSASPVEGASVRLTKAAETYVGSTNASGQVTFNVDDGTWTVSITSPGATFAGASLVVDDDETVSYSLTAISITPSPATQITGYYTCYSHLGVVEAGVSITMQLVGLAQGSVGLALDNRLRTVTSDANGVAQFTNLFPGCRYKVYRGAAENKAWYVNLPDTVTGDPVELGSIYGDDE
jgi:hypothetical protein